MTPIRDLDLIYRTIVAELAQRLFDDYTVPPQGWLVQVPIKGRRFWYLESSEAGRKVRSYVGPVGVPMIEQRVADHKVARDRLRANRKLVTTLVRDAGHKRADEATGAVIAALSAAGLFRKDAVLVGLMAVQCYSVVIGVRFLRNAIPKAGSTIELAARSPALAGLLEASDAVAPLLRSSNCTVRILSPDEAGLAFLIEDPVRTVLLHDGGVPVMLPTPERFALHSLMTGGDPALALTLLQALHVTHQSFELGCAYSELLESSSAEALHAAIEKLGAEDRDFIIQLLRTALKAASFDR